ncbi:hypothetical protein G6F43_010481 [Rhizopus delemar]|nr:hypothetical protein G6F43_010481 [Rhizopus delemar]
MSDFIAAGTETLATTLYWSFAILSQKPDVQSRIVAELDMWKSKNPLGAVPHFHQDRDEFPYAICVQKEIMRFRPVLNFGLPHMASEDVVVNDYFIPKGAVLISSMAAMHENPDFYDDPEVFKPERFMMNTKRMGAAANAKIEDRDHFGFGWGRRICPGIHLAEMELFNFYVRFFSKFKIEPEIDSHGNPIYVDLNYSEELGVTNKPVPCKFRITPHNL